jgi:hypothetical protein
VRPKVEFGIDGIDDRHLGTAVKPVGKHNESAFRESGTRRNTKCLRNLAGSPANLMGQVITARITDIVTIDSWNGKLLATSGVTGNKDRLEPHTQSGDAERTQARKSLWSRVAKEFAERDVRR